MTEIDIKRIGTVHCERCGGTGKIFNSVPGSLMTSTRMLFTMAEPVMEDCETCQGTGHLLFNLEEE